MLSSRQFCRRLTGAVVVAPARLLAVLYHALHANSALLDRVDLPTRLSLSSLDRLPVSRLLLPAQRAGAQRLCAVAQSVGLRGAGPRPELLRVSDAGRSRRCGLDRGRRPKAAKEGTRGKCQVVARRALRYGILCPTEVRAGNRHG